MQRRLRSRSSQRRARGSPATRAGEPPTPVHDGSTFAITESNSWEIAWLPVAHVMSNVAIADHVGVDEKTVARHRADMESGSEIPTLTTRTGADRRATPTSATPLARRDSWGAASQPSKKTLSYSNWASGKSRQTIAIQRRRTSLALPVLLPPRLFVRNIW